MEISIMDSSSTLIEQVEMAEHPVEQTSKGQGSPARHSIWRTAILFTLFTGLVLGVGYPLLITGIAHVVFPYQANGSLILKNGQVIGSKLLAQSFTSNRYFHPRPSAVGYDAEGSGGSNLAQTNAALIQRIQGAINKLQARNPGKPVPIDMVTESGSGLDPDITPDNAFYQAPRVAKARGVSVAAIDALIRQHIQGRELGFLGEPRVNVLELNLALNKMGK